MFGVRREGEIREPCNRSSETLGLNSVRSTDEAEPRDEQLPEVTLPNLSPYNQKTHPENDA